MFQPSLNSVFALLFMAMVLIGPSTGAAGEAESNSKSEERNKAFTWFGTLGFPDVKGHKFVRVATGQWFRSGDDPPQNSYAQGFLLDEKGDTFTVFTLDLATSTFKKTSKDTLAYKRVGYEVRDLKKDAAAQLKALRDLTNSKKEDHWRRFGERLAERAEVFVLAWACWRHGLDELGAELYDHAARMPDRRGERPQGKTLQQLVAQDTAHSEMWRAVLDFGDPSITRRQLLDRFERFVKNYPDSEHLERAKETAALLRQMVKEDTHHATKRKAGKLFEKLSRKEQISELIFQLRDQNGHQWSQPGACDIFDALSGKEDTPAHQLVKIGYDAVPQLIEVLEDQQFTRSVGYHRDFYFSHHVLRIGDCAEQVITRIAGRSFYERTYTNAAMVKDGQAVTVRAEIKAWYSELQKKGEKRVLIEATERGDSNSPYQAERLLAKYPDAAFAALVAGAKTAKKDWTRAALVELAGKAKGDIPIEFLLAEVKEGPFLGSRLAAARSLHARARSEGVSAMIVEWNAQRPAQPRKGPRSPLAEDADSSYGLESIAGFLAGCGKVEAIIALGKGLRQRPVSLRLAVISSFGEQGSSWSLFSSGSGGSLQPSERGARDNPKAVRAAIEQLLVTALDDTEERTGMSGTWNNKSFSDPRICDVAGHILNQVAAERYPFDLSAPLDRRDRSIVELKNIWRKAHGQPLLPVPSAKVIPVVPDDKLRPLLDELLRRRGVERGKVEQEIEKLGLGALPGVLRRVEKLENRNASDREALERLAQRLACIVTDIVVAEDSLKPDNSLSLKLDKMKGKPFEPRAFIQAIGSLVKKLPKGVHAFRFGADRASDGSGFVLKIDLLNDTRAAKLVRSTSSEPGGAALKDEPYGWDYTERVTVGRKSLRGVSGGGTGSHWIEDDYAELREVLTEACSAAPILPIEIRIHLIAEWAR